MKSTLASLNSEQDAEGAPEPKEEGTERAYGNMNNPKKPKGKKPIRSIKDLKDVAKAFKKGQ